MSNKKNVKVEKHLDKIYERYCKKKEYWTGI